MKNLIVVDIQREYDACIPPYLWKETASAVKKAKKVLWYYVDFDVAHHYFGSGIDYANEQSEEYFDLIERLQSEHNLSEHQFGKITFVPKTYGFLRNKMDIGIDEDDIISTLNLMKKLNVNDSRDIKEKYVSADRGTKRMITLLHNRDVLNEHESEPIFTPDFETEQLAHYQHATVIGGGRDECLAEISIYMKHLGIPHRINENLTY